MRTFMFEGDCFAADCTVSIAFYPHNIRCFFKFDDEESAKTKQSEAIRAWNAELGKITL